MDVLLVTDRSEASEEAHSYLLEKLSDKDNLKVIVGESPDENLDPENWTGDVLVSFLSPWIFPQSFLDRANLAINFHPGPPNYPGFDPFSFAVLNNEKEFGITCHHMAEVVDTGPIIQVKRFSMEGLDRDALITKSMSYLLESFKETIDLIIRREKLPVSKEVWLRKPYTREDLIQLTNG